MGMMCAGAAKRSSEIELQVNELEIEFGQSTHSRVFIYESATRPSTATQSSSFVFFHSLHSVIALQLSYNITQAMQVQQHNRR
jgi:hypothetical protein